VGISGSTLAFGFSAADFGLLYSTVAPLLFLFVSKLTTPQTFTSAILSKPADPVIANGGSDPAKPFTCNGDTFSTLTDALKRSCSNQKNDCAKAVNDALSSKTDGGLAVSDCDAQEKDCNSAGAGGLANKELQDGKADQLVFC
jgi:hypothetical protein